MGEDYFWESRGNIPLLPHKSGAYITFVAANGSGYVRILNKSMREMWALLLDVEKENNYLYVEHLAHRLGSVTYYGR